ncbi:EamA family transporter [Methanohalophilus halophilus]|uniref:DMT family transporter n=1 Tax=Methanohalophilus halophilus TaxID=2177 RepID=A0A1L3Q489_9EURY|nr:EamA family transporter [Methanohalophilus halophilus]APH39658.1 EamA family transporter [Methanohalophilus halophilus]RNI09007.1 DMT family transporter [Methanohalophilus halophilus]SDW34791.1 Uncharacterized membrane protein [Methanohalophilus halophilus]
MFPFPAELLVVVFGLAAAMSWGTGDFSGGIATRKTSVYIVVMITQFIGFFLLVTTGHITSEPFPLKIDYLWALLVGIFGNVGILSLYKGLSSGKMRLVAPVSAVVAVLVPVIYSLFSEGLPEFHKVLGFGIALAGVWLVSSSSLAKINTGDLKLPFLAGLGFGLVYISIGNFSGVSIFWTLAVAKIEGATILLLFLLSKGNLCIPAKKVALPILIAGIGDTAGSIFFTAASQVGRLDIATVTSALYPAGTVLLSWIVLGEYLSSRQWMGVFMALFSVILLSV